MYDIAIIGAGPAGLSAAINARVRNKNVIVISNNPLEGYLAKAHLIDNYLGMPSLSGVQLIEAFLEHADKIGIERLQKRIITILPIGDQHFSVNYGDDSIDAHSVILAIGAVPQTKFAGEDEFLGRGVSYCATCDGMFFRNRSVCVIGQDKNSVHEANYLQSIGCNVTYISSKEALGLDAGIVSMIGRRYEILGDYAVTGLIVDEETIPCDGVFVLRPAIAPTNLMSDLELDGAFIKVDREMRTSIPGVYAAGDCVGKPLQINKAAGDGQIAGLAAAEYLDALGIR